MVYQLLVACSMKIYLCNNKNNLLYIYDHHLNILFFIKKFIIFTHITFMLILYVPLKSVIYIIFDFINVS